MLFLQHPDKIWIEFAKQLPELNGKKIGLFTTYKLATGSMFLKMKKHIKCNQDNIIVEMKSRRGHLTEPVLTGLKKLIN
jgi:hypothetical protein